MHRDTAREGKSHCGGGIGHGCRVADDTVAKWIHASNITVVFTVDTPVHDEPKKGEARVCCQDAVYLDRLRANGKGCGRTAGRREATRGRWTLVDVPRRFPCERSRPSDPDECHVSVVAKMWGAGAGERDVRERACAQ